MSAGWPAPNRNAGCIHFHQQRMGSAFSPRTGLVCAPPGLMDGFSSSPSWERHLAVEPGSQCILILSKSSYYGSSWWGFIIGCQSQKHPSHRWAHCDFLSYQGKYEREGSVLILSGGPGPFNPCSPGDEWMK